MKIETLEVLKFAVGSIGLGGGLAAAGRFLISSYFKNLEAKVSEAKSENEMLKEKLHKLELTIAGEVLGSQKILSNQVLQIQSDVGEFRKVRIDVDAAHSKIRDLQGIAPRV